MLRKLGLTHFVSLCPVFCPFILNTGASVCEANPRRPFFDVLYLFIHFNYKITRFLTGQRQSDVSVIMFKNLVNAYFIHNRT